VGEGVGVWGWPKGKGPMTWENGSYTKHKPIHTRSRAAEEKTRAKLLQKKQHCDKFRTKRSCIGEGEGPRSQAGERQPPAARTKKKDRSGQNGGKSAEEGNKLLIIIGTRSVGGTDDGASTEKREGRQFGQKSSNQLGPNKLVTDISQRERKVREEGTGIT